MADRVYKQSSEAVVMSVKNSVELGPWGTCEVFNVVKQVQRDRKGSLARASRLVTLWPSHHRAGSAVGGDVQIAFFSSLFPLPFCHSVSPPLSITHTRISWWYRLIEKPMWLFDHCKEVCFYRYCCGRIWRILLNSLTSVGLPQSVTSNFRRVWLIDRLQPKMLQNYCPQCLHCVSSRLCLLHVILQTVQCTASYKTLGCLL